MSKKSLFELIEETKAAKKEQPVASMANKSSFKDDFGGKRRRASDKKDSSEFEGDLEKEVKDIEQSFSSYSPDAALGGSNGVKKGPSLAALWGNAKKKQRNIPQDLGSLAKPSLNEDEASPPRSFSELIKKQEVAPLLARFDQTPASSSASLAGGFSETQETGGLMEIEEGLPLEEKRIAKQGGAGVFPFNEKKVEVSGRGQEDLADGQGEHLGLEGEPSIEWSNKEDSSLTVQKDVGSQIQRQGEHLNSVPPTDGSAVDWADLVKPQKEKEVKKRGSLGKKRGLNGTSRKEGTGSQEYSERNKKHYGKEQKESKGSRSGVLLTREDYLKKAWNKALWLCSRAEQFSVALEQKLKMDFKKWGVPSEHEGFILKTVMEKLVQLQALDDRRYCFSFLKNRVQRGGLKKAKMELKNKGAPSDLIEQACFALEEEGLIPEEKNILEDLWERKFSSKIPKEEKEKNKQLRFFISKGFSFAQILALWKASKEKE